MFKNILITIIVSVFIVKSQDDKKDDRSSTTPRAEYTTSTLPPPVEYINYYDEFGPQYCTKYHKVNSFALRNYSYYKLTYETAYMNPRQSVAFVLLWCVYPYSTELLVKVCDWLEAPTLDISLHETHMVIMRRDGHGGSKFLGNAEINITQHCPHAPNLAFAINYPYERRIIYPVYPPERDPVHKLVGNHSSWLAVDGTEIKY